MKELLGVGKLLILKNSEVILYLMEKTVVQFLQKKY